jgi:hypothetical protein
MARVPVLAGDAARGSGGPVGLDRAAGGGTGGPATSSLVTAGVMLHTEAPGPMAPLSWGYAKLPAGSAGGRSDRLGALQTTQAARGGGACKKAQLPRAGSRACGRAGYAGGLMDVG